MKLSVIIFNFIHFCQGLLKRRLVDGISTSGKPWMVFLNHPKAICGGVLYTESLVITVAHCSIFSINEWKAYVGIKSVDPIYPYSIFHKILARYNHPNYKEFASYDISVWWINGNSNERTLVKLDDGYELNQRKQPVYALGWGTTERKSCLQLLHSNFENKKSKYLRKISVPLVSDDLCQKRYINGFIPETMFCMGLGVSGPGAGLGDSGGPVYRIVNQRVVLIGIINSGGACGFKDYYDVNTKISNPSVKNFIRYYAALLKPDNYGRKFKFFR